MKLTSEDLLKLNVLMAQKPRAIRIKENTMQVFGLTDVGDACIHLNAKLNRVLYLRAVKEFLADKVSNSPGGFPVHITGWTRLGQTNVGNLQQLLLLGESDAVSAVVYAKGLTPEIGHLAWWCVTESENARRMLEKQQIVESDLGVILAEHLYEHLAFETDPKLIVESVKLMLQPRLLTQEKKDKLWGRSQRKVANLVGFLQAAPEAILHGCQRHHEHDHWSHLDIDKENPFFIKALWFLSEDGQGFLKTTHQVLKKVSNQDVVTYLLKTLEEKLSTFMPLPLAIIVEHPEEISKHCTQLLDTNSEVFNQTSSRWQNLILLCSNDAEQMQDLQSMLFLCHLNPSLVIPVFSRTTAEATLMRKKLKYISDPIFENIERLISHNL